MNVDSSSKSTYVESDPAFAESDPALPALQAASAYFLGAGTTSFCAVTCGCQWQCGGGTCGCTCTHQCVGHMSL